MNNKELDQIREEITSEKGLKISPDDAVQQIRMFEKGIPFIKLLKSCTIGDGIKILPEAKHEYFINKYQTELNNGRLIKFVPASGAATRMFKHQLAVLTKIENVTFEKVKELENKGDEDCKAALLFFNSINRFAFYEDLMKTVQAKGMMLDDLVAAGKIDQVISFVAEEVGLNYANLPKGCILFHLYSDGPRTAFEEHILEAINYSTDNNKVVRVHFTISPEHESEIKKLLGSVKEKYSKDGFTFDIQLSFQSPTTDTISVTMNNKPFRDENGRIVFRPGGHGALLKNLDEIKADIISIKNIDNIVPDYLRGETYKYKKILGGYLIDLQKRIFNFLEELDNNIPNEKIIDNVIEFIKEEFEFDIQDELSEKSPIEKQKHLFNYLNRPIRICGMVKKEEHPGGGPFWVESETGEISKQIVESAQIDVSDRTQKKIFNEATHFNPVDLVCGVKDFKGNSFLLSNYANPDTGLIVKKSKDGKDLKALELPGLWNGGMYHWLTIFVEVPKITFNPVKEVNDLLKPEHQPERNK